MGIRATIGANLGLVCPGIGALKEEEARDELENSLPYVDFDPLTDSLNINFVSQDYARRFELGLKRWHDEELNIPFTNDCVLLSIEQSKKPIIGLNGERLERIFYATISVLGSLAISLLLEKICGLSPDYLIELQKLSGSQELEIFNNLIQIQALGDWATPENSWGLTYESPAPVVRERSILTIRAASDMMRMNPEQVANTSRLSRASSSIFHHDYSDNDVDGIGHKRQRYITK
jgi:hypothetical protein